MMIPSYSMLLVTLSWTLFASAQHQYRGSMQDPRSVLTKETCSPHPHVIQMSMYSEDKSVYEHFYSNPPKCEGTVVEIGAFDGKNYSPSLWFEFALRWKALLVEAYPKNFNHLYNYRKRAAKYQGAICKEDQVIYLPSKNRNMGGIKGDMSETHMELWIPKEGEEREEIAVKCHDMTKILLENNMTHVDVMFIDVSGSELRVLETIDFNVIEIDVLVVDLDPIHEKNDNIQSVRELLTQNLGYLTPFSLQQECQTEFQGKILCIEKVLFVRPGFWAEFNNSPEVITSDQQ